MKIGNYTDNEILEFMTEGEGRSFLGRSMFDAMYFEIERLNNIINELEKYLEDYHNNTGLGEYETGIDDGICDTLKKLQELKGSDKG